MLSDREPRGPDAVAGEATRRSLRLVFKNTLLLVSARLLVVPLSLVINAVMARSIGASDFGDFYLASTFVGFAFVVVAWGQDGTLPARVAQDHARAGELLGSAIAWRLLASPVAYVVLAALFVLLGYSAGLQLILVLVFVYAAIAGFTQSGLETVRGFERTDVAAVAQVCERLLALILVIPVLRFGAGLPGALLAFIASILAVLGFVAWSIRKLGVGAVFPRYATVRELLREGWPFMVFGLSLVLQSTIDAAFLSRLAPREVVGWYGASQKLIGFVIFPAGAIIGALYPTLCRLRVEDPQTFEVTTRRVVESTILLGVPLGLSCLLFAEYAVNLFGQDAFGPAAQNVRVLGLFVVLVYVSMPIGSSLLAAGRQIEWTLVQVVTLVTTVILDPILIPWFQERVGNGGLGVCASTLVSEIIMVSVGLWLLPRGTLTRSLALSTGRAVAAGLAMVVAAALAAPLPVPLAAPLSLTAYTVVLWLFGGLDRRHLKELRDLISRRRPAG